jgi:hypothetical protein
MKNIVSKIAICSIVTLVACKKEKNVEPSNCSQQIATTQTYPNYSNLKVGNYWIYERFIVDEFGVATSLNQFDSCYVEKDTLINGMTYFKYMSSKYNFPSVMPLNQNPITAEYYRDSLSYIVSSVGRIEFSSDDFSSIFKLEYVFDNPPNDTVCKVISKMGDQNLNVSLPLGNFTTSSFKETYYMTPINNFFGAIRYRDTRYAENVGKVTEGFNFFLSNPNRWERRLIRYHLN